MPCLNENEFFLHATARVVIIDQGHILLHQKQAKHGIVYFLPGGHIELQEKAQDAIIREIKEEIGFLPRKIRFLGCIENVVHPRIFFAHDFCHTHEYVFIFLADIPECKFPEVPCCEQNCTLYWMPIDKLETANFVPPQTAHRVLEWIDQDYSGAFVEATV